MSATRIAELLARFEVEEAHYQGIVTDPGVVADVTEFLGKMLVRYDAYERAGIVTASSAAGAAASAIPGFGPLAGPGVGLAVKLLLDVALRYGESLAPPRPTTPPPA